MVWSRNLACGLIGLACAAGCGGESSRRGDDGGEGAEGGATGGTGATSKGGSVSTGGSTASGGTSRGGSPASGGSVSTGGSSTSGGSSTGGSSASGGSAGSPPGPLSDLYFYEFHAEDAVGIDGEGGAYVSFAIANQGDAPAPAPHRFSLVLSTDAELGNDDDVELFSMVIDNVIPPADPFQTPGVTLDGFVALDMEFADGLYYVGGIIDADDQVAESNEANNERLSNRIFVGVEEYNVEAAELTAPTGIAQAGSDILVALTVRASGDTPVASADFDIVLSEDDAIDANDTVLCFGTTGPLGPGEEVSVETDCTVPRLRGEYYLGVRLDPDDVLHESNEDDNVLVLEDPLEVTSPDVDLTVAGFSGNDLELEWLGDLDLTVQIENSGSEDAGPLQLTMYLSEDAELDESDVQVCQRLVVGLAASSVLDVLIQCHLPTAAAGELRLIAVVDSSDAVFETAEDNNTGLAEGAITIASPDFDLVYALHNVTSPDQLRAGDEFNLTLQVLNTGAIAIPGFDFDVYFSTDATVTDDDVLACSHRWVESLPGSTVANVMSSCTVPATLAAGDYYLGFLLDPNAQLPETNESNNRGVDQSPRPVLAQ